MHKVIIVSIFLLFKAYRLLSVEDEEGEWEPWEQIQKTGQRIGSTEAHRDLSQKTSGTNQR